MPSLKETVDWYRSDFNDKYRALEVVFQAHLIASVMILDDHPTPFSQQVVAQAMDGLQFSPAAMLSKLRLLENKDFALTQTVRSAKRIILADAFDQLTESFCRCYDAVTKHDFANPYESDQPVWYTSSKLFKGTKGAQYFATAERKFFECLMTPLRDAIRHNNAFVAKNNEIHYHETLYGLTLDVDVTKGMVINATLPVALQIFQLNQAVGNLGFDRLLTSTPPERTAKE